MVSPTGVFTVGFVSGIGAGSSVAAFNVGAHRAEPDSAGESAVTHAQEFTVPIGGGHPYLETDVGIGGRFEHSSHAAEGGEFVDGAAIRWRESSRGHRLGGGDGGIRKRRAGETFTGGGKPWRRRGQGGQEGECGNSAHPGIIASGPLVWGKRNLTARTKAPDRARAIAAPFPGRPPARGRNRRCCPDLPDAARCAGPAPPPACRGSL